MGRIADIYQSRGELEEALRIREMEVLPTLERLNDKRGLLVARANLAIGLLTRDRNGDRERAISLLKAAHGSAFEMRIPEAEQIAGILRRIGALLSNFLPHTLPALVGWTGSASLARRDF